MRIESRSIPVFAAIALVGSICQAAAFIPLGTLGFPGDRQATALSADGRVVVGIEDAYEQSSRFESTFRWTREDGLSSGVAAPPGAPNALSADGSVVVGYSLSGWDGGGNAYKWDLADGATLLPFQGGERQVEAFSVSADGRVIVGYSYDGEQSRAARWENGVPVVVESGVNGSRGSSMTSISADGSVAVGIVESADGWTHLAKWSADGQVTLLPTPDNVMPYYGRLSRDGSTIVGNVSDFSVEGYLSQGYRLSSGGSFQLLGDLPGGDKYSWARDVSADGALVVGGSSTGYRELGEGLFISTDDAFLWDQQHGMRNLKDVLESEYGLNLAGWQLSEAVGISADGKVIAGNGYNPQGLSEPWIVILPEPSALVLFFAGAIFALSATIRRTSKSFQTTA